MRPFKTHSTANDAQNRLKNKGRGPAVNDLAASGFIPTQRLGLGFRFEGWMVKVDAAALTGAFTGFHAKHWGQYN